ncbi:MULTISPECIES: LacI family DNA-binding transcriptional regulator [Deinococcus]|uniref:Transcriptional regulator, LacI family n=1 Tax=Deinococcus geothermalis (strain DSM 11300 / CIP 105573 / AG-3a) TaxID=319795 RepID=Q1J2J7_DEIGD|nr:MULTISPECIES: substrate-binding domain-containing protein [Deinococcus]ABF44287.1 transcriptional regulator, LacI family [Deinococcus geothermalis DSM 11300]MBI0446355.1 LacI family DNA-binding transcriptional regulator [Deinococcus sp. DB0503]TDE85611.1 LacI family DNA-binding transcriptional regulator [Deinococcus sp. S9]
MAQSVSPRQPVTLAEVAREAGVSPSTVSRILNGTAQVKANKVAQVRAAIEKLGYKPNAFARGLAKGASGSIGVLTQDIASPFYGDALGGIERGLMGSGYSPLIISGHWRTDEEEHAIELFMSRRVEALIVLGGHLPEEELRQLAQQLPVAVLGREVDFASPGSISLALDNRQAAYDLVSYLLDRGHRRIGHIMGPQDHADARDRLDGYRQALEDRGLPFQPSLVVQGDFHEPSGLIGTQQLLAQHPDMTAIFSANDQMAYGARLALYRLGLRVPEDMSLVGFDDLPGSAYTTPPLTSVRQPMAEMGHWLARFVVAQLTGQTVEPFQPRMELRLRESVATRRLP